MNIRQQLINAVEQRFKGIAKSADYLTDIGQRVFVARPVKPTDAEAAKGVLNIWDLEQETNVGPVSLTHEHLLKISVYVIYAGADAATVIRNVLADLAKAIGTDVCWGGLAQETNPVKDEYELDQEKNLTGAVRYQFQIRYRTAMWDYNTSA